MEDVTHPDPKRHEPNPPQLSSILPEELRTDADVTLAPSHFITKTSTHHDDPVLTSIQLEELQTDTSTTTGSVLEELHNPGSVAHTGALSLSTVVRDPPMSLASETAQGQGSNAAISAGLKYTDWAEAAVLAESSSQLAQGMLESSVLGQGHHGGLDVVSTTSGSLEGTVVQPKTGTLSTDSIHGHEGLETRSTMVRSSIDAAGSSSKQSAEAAGETAQDEAKLMIRPAAATAAASESDEIESTLLCVICQEILHQCVRSVRLHLRSLSLPK